MTQVDMKLVTLSGPTAMSRSMRKAAEVAFPKMIGDLVSIAAISFVLLDWDVLFTRFGSACIARCRRCMGT